MTARNVLGLEVRFFVTACQQLSKSRPTPLTSSHLNTRLWLLVLLILVITEDLYCHSTSGPHIVAFLIASLIRISPVINNVKRYPGQGEATGDSKIPTVVVYGLNGDVRAIGAEAEDESFKDQIENEGMIVAKWFKLHLRPAHLHSTQSFDDIPPLPLGKTVVTVFADMLRYLFNCARTYIIEASGFNGNEIWHSKKDIILTHPNGWEGTQQAAMRQAAILAGIIPDTQEGRDSVRFVTEGEASLHYCVSHGVVPKTLKEGDTVIVVDAGGGTIDITGYRKKSDNKFLFVEAAAPECYFNGSVFVSRNAKAFLDESLRGSKYHETTNYIAERFDKTAKLTFRDTNRPTFIRFGSIYEKDPEFNIQSGKLKLDGTVVAGFFQPSIDCIAEAIEAARHARGTKAAFLVGGFAASDWLFNSLEHWFQIHHISIFRPDQLPGKAVADGAVSFHLDHFVNARVSKFHYGINCTMLYNPTDLEHIERSSQMFVDLDGKRRISGSFSIILPRKTTVTEAQEFESPYCQLGTSPRGLGLEIKILQYKGAHKRLLWIPEDLTSEWSVMCTIEVASSSLSKIAKEQYNYQNLTKYYQVDFSVVLLFGQTEFQAQLCWNENGEKKRSPAKVIYTDVV